MNYQIHKVEKRSENGVEVDQILTLEVTYGDSSTTQHGKVIALDADVKEEAVNFAAELEAVLKEPVVETKEEVEVKVKDKEVKEADVVAKVAEAKVVKVEEVKEVIEEINN